jgi:hypothetical protein
MIVVEQLASEFEIELVVELMHPFDNFGRLLPDIMFVVESFFKAHESSPPPVTTRPTGHGSSDSA